MHVGKQQVRRAMFHPEVTMILQPNTMLGFQQTHLAFHQLWYLNQICGSTVFKLSLDPTLYLWSLVSVFVTWGHVLMLAYPTDSARKMSMLRLMATNERRARSLTGTAWTCDPPGAPKVQGDRTELVKALCEDHLAAKSRGFSAGKDRRKQDRPRDCHIWGLWKDIYRWRIWLLMC